MLIERWIWPAITRRGCHSSPAITDVILECFYPCQSVTPPVMLPSHKSGGSFSRKVQIYFDRCRHASIKDGGGAGRGGINDNKLNQDEAPARHWPVSATDIPFPIDYNITTLQHFPRLISAQGTCSNGSFCCETNLNIRHLGSRNGHFFGLREPLCKWGFDTK